VSSSTAKRLIVYRFDRQPSEALVHADAYLLPGGVELMTSDGNLQLIDYKAVKALCFAAEGAPADLFSAQTTFDRRPKTPGLWASFRLRDGDVLEGVLPHNLLEWPVQGFLLTPPRSGTYRQRVFLPREAVSQTLLRGTMGGAAPFNAKGAKKGERGDEPRQLSIFDSV
jgi:hypothetical protein